MSHQSTCQLIYTRTLARTKKPLFYPASGIGYSQLDVSTSRAADTENCSGGGDSILPVDETADNRSNVFYEAINAADEVLSDTPDTYQTPEIVIQIAESMDKTRRAYGYYGPAAANNRRPPEAYTLPTIAICKQRLLVAY